MDDMATAMGNPGPYRYGFYQNRRKFTHVKKPLRITFLGTGTSQGVPVIGSDHPVCHSTDHRDKRLRVSVLVSWEGFNYVIDCGPDFRQQMLVNKVDHIDGILFTHEHADHTAGIDDIRPIFSGKGIFLFMPTNVWSRNSKSALDIFSAKKTGIPGRPPLRSIV